MQTTNRFRFLIAVFLIVIGFKPNSINCHMEHNAGNHEHYKQDPNEAFQMDKLMHDREHLQEDLDDLYGIGAGITDYFVSKQEMEFIFFQNHDLDMNDKLDGLEMMHAIAHIEHESQPNNLTQEELKLAENNVDDILAKYDTNNDGFLSYNEFAIGNQF